MILHFKMINNNLLRKLFTWGKSSFFMQNINNLKKTSLSKTLYISLLPPPLRICQNFHFAHIFCIWQVNLDFLQDSIYVCVCVCVCLCACVCLCVSVCLHLYIFSCSYFILSSEVYLVKVHFPNFRIKCVFK